MAVHPATSRGVARAMAWDQPLEARLEAEPERLQGWHAAGAALVMALAVLIFSAPVLLAVAILVDPGAVQALS
jgi:hypothetical protein